LEGECRYGKGESFGESERGIAVRSKEERVKKMAILEGGGVAECVGEMVGVERGK